MSARKVLIRGITVSAALATAVAGGCGSLTSMDQIVYKPTVDRVGDLRCSDNGRQRFRIGGDRIASVVGVIPDGSDGESRYNLHVVVIAEGEQAKEFGAVDVALVRATSDGTPSGSGELVLRPRRNAPREHETFGEKAVVTRTWSQEFAIDPDLDPRTDKHLSLRLSIEYLGADGESRVMEAMVPLAPQVITIPISRV